MRISAIAFLLLASCTFGDGVNVDTGGAGTAGVYDLHVNALDGTAVDLAQFRGKVALVVNVASRCGFTSQYAGLQALHEQFAARGFSVIGVPSNDFGGQEPGTPAEIQQFCSDRYAVTFSLLAKAVTQPGAEQAELYRVLAERTGKLPSWNFGKYLVSRDGRRVRFFGTRVAPDDAELRAAIEEELAAG